MILGPGSRGPGLCGRCQHVRRVENRRGSTFYLCRLSEVDPRFRRYPPLPVLRCAGFKAEGDPGSREGGGNGG